MRHSLLVIVGVTSTLVGFGVGCKNPFADAPPLEPGQTMTYTITEAYRDRQESWVLRARLVEAQDWLELRMETPRGVLPIPVRSDLTPIDEKLAPVELPLASTSSAARLGPMWLPSAYRRGGAEWDGFSTRSILRREMWKVWEVIGPDGMPRYYEIETGLLVEFRLLTDEVRVTGTLVSAQ